VIAAGSRRVTWPPLRRVVVSCCLIAVAACTQVQTPSNVGSDGLDRGAASAALGSVGRLLTLD